MSPVFFSKLPHDLSPLVIVEDSTDDHFAFSRLLKRAGIPAPLLWFQSGQAALDELERRSREGQPLPPWMFLDLKLPDIGGHDILRWVRARPEFKPMRIAVISGSTDYADVRLAAELGADFYFEKFPSAETIRRMMLGERVATPSTSVSWSARDVQPLST